MDDLTLTPYSDEDLPLLRRINAPEMMTHLGGPEDEATLLKRHAKYRDGVPGGHVFRIDLDGAGINGTDGGVGQVAYWPSEEDGEPIHEMGWSVLPEFQGRGIAVRAVALALANARERGAGDVYAFPKIDHDASNGVCRRAGFELLRSEEFEYPKGNPIISNVWVHRVR